MVMVFRFMALSLAIILPIRVSAGDYRSLVEKSASALRLDVAANPPAVGGLQSFADEFLARRKVQWLKPDATGIVYAFGMSEVKCDAAEGFFAARDEAYRNAVRNAAAQLKSAGFADVDSALCTVCSAERRINPKVKRFAVGVVVKLDGASATAMGKIGVKASGGVPPGVLAPGGVFSSSQLIGTRFFWNEAGEACVIAFAQHPCRKLVGRRGRGLRNELCGARRKARESALRELESFAAARNVKFPSQSAEIVDEGVGVHPGGIGFAYSVLLWKNGGLMESSKSAGDGTFDF